MSTVFLPAIIGGLGPWELILILLIVLIVFGAGKLPQIGDALGKGINSFRKASQDAASEDAEPGDAVASPQGQLPAPENQPVVPVQDVEARDVTPPRRS